MSSYRGRGRGGRGRGGGRGGGGRGRGSRPQYDGDNQSEQRNKTPFMGYRRLAELSEKDPQEVALALLSSKSGFKELLQTGFVKPDWVGLLLGILQKACTCSYPNQVAQILNLVRTSKFLESVIPTYLTQMTIEPSHERQLTFKKPISDLLKLLKEMMTRMPHSYMDIVVAVVQVQATMDTMQRISTIVDDEMVMELAVVISMRDTLAENMRTRSTTGGEDSPELRPPPDDFREKSIFPQLDDVNDNRPFLRASKVKGQYPDVETYLDIQFRLLREDFVRPLREGIQEYLDVTGRGQDTRRLQNVRVYRGVQVLYPVCTFNGTSYRIKFDSSRMKRVNWEKSRRLIYGSLVCLSKDRFQSLLFATVADRKPKDLANGEIEVRFENVNYDETNQAANDVYTMVETSAYFEAYRHVLKALQDTNENNFPFQKYIINCSLKDADMKPPSYLLRHGLPRYDLTPFLKKGLPAAEGQSVSVLNTTRWPRDEQLQFDESQLKAVQSALTKEFVVIQGPPGTGKTYLGLKVVEVLLRNKTYWHTDATGNDKSPIFIVCYTNHALDQFLEGIFAFQPTGIVRVGGRSSSTKLEGCMLKNLRSQVKKNRETPRDIFQGLRDTRDEMTQLRAVIDRTAADIEATNKGIIKETHIEEFIEDRFHVHLQIGVHESYSSSSSIMVDWLGLGNVLYQSAGQAMVEENPDPDEDEEEENSEEELAIEDEAAMRERQQLDDIDEDDITPAQREELRRRVNQERAAEALAVNIDAINQQAFDSDGWEVQPQNKKDRKRRMRQGLNSTDAMSEQQVARVRDIWALPLNERWRLYHYWINRYIMSLRGRIRDLERQYDNAAGRIQEIKMQEDMHIMRTATVLGMTTTGAAKYRAALQQIKPKIVIVEEAAEVLEAHIVTTLSEGCQHLILIGDHKQLRPSANVYELAKKFNLEISLFERMVFNDVAFSCLQLQHRMRPTIARLMEPIYPQLKNDASVEEFENIKGVASNLFFIDHVQPESHNEELKSKSNTHEAKYIVALCRYLILQGYSPEQITILTLYSGQLFLIREFMKPRDFFKGARLTVVDNFQGEENDIILLSLVRSNADGSIGFLSIENRVCVALSRARKGLYVIGNFDLLQSSEKTKLWSRLATIVSKENLIGKELTLYCQNHKEAEIKAKTADDFMKAPEGGCTKPCEVRLQCGHTCPRICHHDDKDHSKFKCMKPCQKVICDSGHRCTRLCHQKCGPCRVPVTKTVPSCGHSQTMGCQESPLVFKCRSPCTKTLPGCGHSCKNKCGEMCQDKCTEVVTRQWPCTHIVKTQCHRKPKDFPCPSPCGVQLQCGHQCSGTCGECCQGRLHVPCKHKCDRTLVCGHACAEPCTSNCPPCTKKCENRCSHSKCTSKCGKPCVPCKEPCDWRCSHYKCSMLCSEPCDRPRCDQPCLKALKKCGHQCIGVCGEKCPNKCRICDKDEVTDIFFGTEDEDDALFVQLEDCGHIFEVSGLDQWMDSAQDTSDGKVDVQMKACPRCKTVVRRNRRYGNILNGILEDIEKVKRVVLGEGNGTDNVENERRLLVHQLRMAPHTSPYTEFLMSVENQNAIVSMELITIIKNQLAFVKRINSIKKKVDKELLKHDTRDRISSLMDRLHLHHGSSTRDISSKDEAVGSSLHEELDSLLTWISRFRIHISDQEMEDFNTELERVSLLVNYHRVRMHINERKSTEFADEMDEIHRILTCGKKLVPRSEDVVKKKLKRINEQLGGLGISNEERVQILKAMGLSKGHWYKCPNGHVYAIGDCGGANQESTCPECKQRIGGTSHRLLPGNEVATEMDGARYAAWSEQANLENYPDLMNI